MLTRELMEKRFPESEIRWRAASGYPFPKEIKPIAVRKCKAHNAPLAHCWLVWVYIGELGTYVFGASFEDWNDAVTYADKRRAAA